MAQGSLSLSSSLTIILFITQIFNTISYAHNNEQCVGVEQLVVNQKEPQTKIQTESNINKKESKKNMNKLIFEKIAANDLHISR